ncbi:MAG: DMT family transporter [Pseudomonadota bacterium]
MAWLWGSSFLAVGIGVETLDPETLVAGRMVIGAVILIAVLLVGGGTLGLGVRGWAIAAVVGMSANTVPFLLISFGQQKVDSGLAALIMGIGPVVTLSLAPLVHAEETLGVRKVIGAAIGFGGIIVLVGPEALQGLGSDVVPQLMIVGAALCYAFTALFTRRFPHSDPMQMAAGSVLIGAVTLAVYVGLVSGVDLPNPSVRSLWAMVYLGLGPTALAALIFFRLIPRIGAGRVQQINYVVPVLGLILGVVFLGERPEWNALLAIPMILFAVYLVSWKTGRAAEPSIDVGVR